MNEITRLKEEANRFISILSQEEDPEKSDELLSPGKRQSLTREVESLQVQLMKKKLREINYVVMGLIFNPTLKHWSKFEI